MYYTPQNKPIRQRPNPNYKKPGTSTSKSKLPVDFLFILYCVLTPFYFEVVAKIATISTGKNLYSPKIFAYIFFYCTAIGLLLYVVCRLIPRRTIRLTITIVVSIIELVLVAYEITMLPFNGFQGIGITTDAAGDVAGGFMGNVFTTVLYNLLNVLFLAIPVVLLIVFNRRVIRAARPAKGLRTACIIAMIIAYLITMLLVYTDANDRDDYTSTFATDTAMKRFGILSGMRLDIKYSLLDSDSSHKSSGKNANDVLNGDDADSAEQTTDNKDPDLPDKIPEGNNETIDFATLSSSNSNIQELNEYFATQQPSSKNQYTGYFEGKNCIFITAESFTPYFVSEEKTPTLYKLLNNGFVFNNYYQPAWGVSTSDGEYSGLTGLVPEAGINSMKATKGNNLYTSLGNSFSRLGYFTEAYHANSYTYYDRNETHPNFGYSKFIGYGNGIEAAAEGGTVNKSWPESDVEAMDFIIPRILEQAQNGTPFHIYYMSVSGHPNYNFSGNAMASKNKDRVADLPYSDEVKAYYACNYEFEDAMTYLVSELEKAGILDDTVIVINADHYPYGLDYGFNDNTKDYLSELVGHTIDQNFERHKNQLVIYCSSMKNAVQVDDPCYSLDILPTLSNLFGFEFDSRLYTGRDVFSNAAPLVLFRNYSWITAKGSYNSSTKQFTPVEGATVSDTYVSDVTAIVKDKVYFAKQILETDYFNYLFSK